MNPYDRYPGIDSDHNFPQEVREALANSSELRNMTSGAIEGSLGEYDQVIREDLIAYKKIDTDAPSRPAKPLLSLSFGAVTVRATGKAYAGGDMEPDLDHYRPQVNNNDGLGFVNEGAAVPAPDGSIELYGKPAGPISVRLVAVDESGNASDPGESETITVVPIKTAEAVQEEYLEAQQAVNERMGVFEEDLEVVDGRAQAAESAATAAEARATEANNRSMTRLANGNFEQGLDYWTGTIELAAEGHSGDHSGLIGGGYARTSSSLPVVEGQIWEMQFFYKAANPESVGKAFFGALWQEDGTAPVGSYNIISDATEEWKSSGINRVTIPEGLDSVFPRFGHTNDMGQYRWLIDDVVLRDVTDVVRLEEAANAARKKAEDAEARAIAVEQVQGGIDDRLSAAETNITNSSTQAVEDLANLDEALRVFTTETVEEAAVAAAVLRIDSSRGVVFKNNTIATVLTVTVFYSGMSITNITDLHASFGSGAYLEWFWRREDDEDFGLISSADNRLSNAGFSLTVSPDDVDEKTIFQCYLNT